jgi:hypothetical protein
VETAALAEGPPAPITASTKGEAKAGVVDSGLNHSSIHYPTSTDTTETDSFAAQAATPDRRGFS